MRATLLPIFKRFLSNGSGTGAKVAICGASGGIGQPLALLLKQIPYIKELSLYDIKGAAGVGADLSHINTSPLIVSASEDPDECIAGSDIVVIPAGMPRKPGMTRDDLFNTNASICASLVDKIALNCPNAIICIITNPVNSTVPIASEVLKHRKVYNPRKLFGVTTLDIVRANTFVSQLKNISVDKVQVPVVAGHSGDTIVPLLSQVVPKCSFTEKERDALVKRIQNAGTEVVNAKAGAGSATLSMAFAASRFVQSILKAKFGETGIVECALSEESDARQEPRFFSRPHLLGLNGIEKSLELGNISKAEETLLQKANEELSKNIKKGIEFGKNYCKQLN